MSLTTCLHACQPSDVWEVFVAYLSALNPHIHVGERETEEAEAENVRAVIYPVV